jgi:hypothetical protein
MLKESMLASDLGLSQKGILSARLRIGDCHAITSDVRKSILRSGLRRLTAPALTFHQHSAVQGEEKPVKADCFSEN